MYITFEIFLANFSFLILLISMLIYWIQASNFEFEQSLEGGFFQKTIFKNFLNIFGSVGMLISNLCLFMLLALRWYESGHFPLSNLYESLMFLSWSLTLIHLFVLEIFSKSSILENVKSNTGFLINNSEPTVALGIRLAQKKNLLINKLIGSITAPCALFTNAFATFSLPKEMQESAPLVPALQSNWLMMHVTVMILSYAALILGSLLSIGFLVISNSFDFEKYSFKTSSTSKTLFLESFQNTQTDGLSDFLIFNNAFPKVATGPLLNKSLQEQDQKNRFNLAKTLDNLSYRILGLGFPLLTIGILSGAVWANEAWGSYWSWDPKETWALLTWLVFAIYLHTRLTKGWEGKKPALIASLGFVTVWICFLGVNLIGEGLHSYGWLS
jgi:cytochrome c-type biogenesis protein CcsB